MLGKVTNPELDCLCLQRGENEESQWDPRSFAQSVIVPWVGENENVLGTSEVKERTIRLADVVSFDEKLSHSELTEAMINAPGVHSSDTDEVGNRIRLMWGRGINLYNATIEQLVSVTLSLAGEDARLRFVTEVGKQLDEFARPSGKAAWRDLLKSILDGTEPA